MASNFATHIINKLETTCRRKKMSNETYKITLPVPLTLQGMADMIELRYEVSLDDIIKYNALANIVSLVHNSDRAIGTVIDLLSPIATHVESSLGIHSTPSDTEIKRQILISLEEIYNEVSNTELKSVSLGVVPDSEKNCYFRVKDTFITHNTMPGFFEYMPKVYMKTRHKLFDDAVAGRLKPGVVCRIRGKNHTCKTSLLADIVRAQLDRDKLGVSNTIYSFMESDESGLLLKGSEIRHDLLTEISWVSLLSSVEKQKELDFVMIDDIGVIQQQNIIREAFFKLCKVKNITVIFTESLVSGQSKDVISDCYIGINIDLTIVKYGSGLYLTDETGSFIEKIVVKGQTVNKSC